MSGFYTSLVKHPYTDFKLINFLKTQKFEHEISIKITAKIISLLVVLRFQFVPEILYKGAPEVFLHQ
jgi:hypothetical protein